MDHSTDRVRLSDLGYREMWKDLLLGVLALVVVLFGVVIYQWLAAV